MVGVIDSGIYPAHEDFEGVTLSGYPEEISVTIRGGGKPRTETTPLGPDDEAYWGRDFFGHGTHVSGIITAVGANGTGVVGVSPGNVKIHMVKVFGDSGAWIYSSTLVDAAQRASAAGAKIINMS
jgi:serine protease